MDLSKKLTELGYFSTSTVEEPGTFSKRGEIFDIYPISHAPVRLHYFDDLIEDIFEIDIETQKTKRDKIFQKVTLISGAGILTKDAFSTNLRTHLPQPQPVFKNKFEARKQILSKVGEGQLFENYPLYIPLFLKTQKQFLISYPKIQR